MAGILRIEGIHFLTCRSGLWIVTFLQWWDSNQKEFPEGSDLRLKRSRKLHLGSQPGRRAGGFRTQCLDFRRSLKGSSTALRPPCAGSRGLLPIVPPAVLEAFLVPTPLASGRIQPSSALHIYSPHYQNTSLPLGARIPVLPRDCHLGLVQIMDERYFHTFLELQLPALAAVIFLRLLLVWSFLGYWAGSRHLKPAALQLSRAQGPSGSYGQAFNRHGVPPKSLVPQPPSRRDPDIPQHGGSSLLQRSPVAPLQLKQRTPICCLLLWRNSPQLGWLPKLDLGWGTLGYHNRFTFPIALTPKCFFFFFSQKVLASAVHMQPRKAFCEQVCGIDDPTDHVRTPTLLHA